MDNKTAGGPYAACLTSKDEEPYAYGVSGPGQGLGYHAWLGWPQNTFETLELAEKTARMMNIAFQQGKAARSKQIADLLK